MADETIEVGHCKECDGTDVDYRIWKNANTGVITGEYYDDEDTWCNDCEEHNGIVYRFEPIPK